MWLWVAVFVFTLIPPAFSGVQRQSTVDKSFERALNLHQSGDLEGAAQAYREFLGSYPDSLEGRSNLGAVYARMGDYGKAIIEYKRALELDPQNVAIRFNLGLAHYETTAIPDAAASFAKVVAAQPNNKNAVLLLSDCYLRMGENKKVIELLSPHEPAYGNDRTLLHLLGTALVRDNQVEKGQVLIERILKQGDSAEARLMLGTAHMMAGHYRGAMDEFARAFDLNPKLASANAYYGRALLATGDRKGAMESFRRELEINPNDFDSNLNMGVLYKQDRKSDQALIYLQRALRVRPGAPSVRYLMGSLYLSTGTFQDARLILEELVREEPDFIEAHETLASVYDRIGSKEDGGRHRDIVNELNADLQARVAKPEQGDVTRLVDPAADATTTSALPLSKPAATPSDSVAGSEKSFDSISGRASAAREADRTVEAMELYGRALEMKPSWHEGWWYLATLLYEEDRYAEARDGFAKLINLKPEGGDAWAMHGLCEFQLRNFERAYQDLQKARVLGIPAKTHLNLVLGYHLAVLFNYYEKPESALPILYGLAHQEGDKPSIVTAMGLCALALPYLPTRLPPEKLDVVTKAGRTQYLIATRKMDEAKKALEKLIEEFPATPNVRYNYGVFLLAGTPDLALAEFQKELEISPSHVPARLQIAFEYIKQHEFDKGLQYAQEAVRLSPKSFAARNALGRILLGKGEIKAAIEELESGLRLAPDSPEMYYALARAYARDGRKEDAARVREEFVRLDRLRRASRQGPQAVGGIEPAERDIKKRPELD